MDQPLVTPPASPPITVESLEARRLCSISAAHHLITVKGNGSQPNTITVGLTADHQSVFVDTSYPTKKGPRTQSEVYALSGSYQYISIIGGNKADLITVDQTNGSFPIMTRIMTHNGNDTVLGGDEPDHIVLGSGADSVMTGNGTDSLFAGRGPDTLIAGDGNDIIHSGKGHDLMEVGNGSSIFADPYGHNTLLAGSGPDIYLIKNKNLALDPDNNYDPNKDTLKAYPKASKDSDLAGEILGDVLDYLL